MAERPEKTETRQAASPGFQTPDAGVLQGLADGPNTSVELVPNARPREWWFVELWWESREIFKELVRHILFFGMLIGGLILFHNWIENSGLPPARKAMLDDVHFWGSVVSLVIFTVSFMIKLIIYEIRGKKHE